LRPIENGRIIQSSPRRQRPWFQPLHDQKEISMSRRLLIAAVSVIGIGLLSIVGLRTSLLSANDVSAPKGAAASKRDTDTIKRLEHRIAALEARVEALEKRGAVPITFAPAELNLTPVAPPQPLPQDWSVREFNGVPVYTIPIDGNLSSKTESAVKSQR
jgi:hypothetical protein